MPPRARPRFAIQALAALALALTPALAQAATCPSTATIQRISPSGTVLDFNQHHPQGAPLRGNVLRREDNYATGHFYELNGAPVTVHYGLNTYELSGDATIALQCYGQAKGANVLYPAINLLAGRATVILSASDPGGVITNEGLYGPIPGQRLNHVYTFRVVRALRKPADHIDLLNWFAGFANQPIGTTTIDTRSTSLVNVTPYVGSGPGQCRHVHKAILTSTGFRKMTAGYFVPIGSARYVG